MDTSRFVADQPPVIVPKGATRKEALELAFPAVPPPEGTQTRAEYDHLVLNKPGAMSSILRALHRK